MPDSDLRMGKTPATMKCPHCRASITTVVRPVKGCITYLCSVAICLVGGVLGCCLIPCYLDCSRDLGHYCPECNKYIGRYDKIRKYDTIN